MKKTAKKTKLVAVSTADYGPTSFEFKKNKKDGNNCKRN